MLSQVGFWLERVGGKAKIHQNASFRATERCVKSMKTGKRPLPRPTSTSSGVIPPGPHCIRLHVGAPEAIPADRFMKLKTFQKMNHFASSSVNSKKHLEVAREVGMSSITRKNNLGLGCRSSDVQNAARAELAEDEEAVSQGIPLLPGHVDPADGHVGL